MPVGTNPRNRALFQLEYSTDGTNFTAFGTEVKSAKPNGALARKMLERKLLGTPSVEIFPARIDYGTWDVALEYSSATFNTVYGWFTNKTLVYLREQADDTGGTNNSKHVTSGYITMEPPEANGEDEVAEFAFKLRARSYSFSVAV
jgi:hypothetical protein